MDTSKNIIKLNYRGWKTGIPTNPSLKIAYPTGRWHFVKPVAHSEKEAVVTVLGRS